MFEVVNVLNGILSGKKMRGQAAMEYLMTYGWALLVIVVVIALLIMINPLRPQAGCHFDQISFSCSDPLVDSAGTLYLKINNGNSNNVNLYGISCTTDKSPKPPFFNGTTLLQKLQRQETYELKSSTTASGNGLQCYDAKGAKAAPAAGSDFSGKLWVFYQNEEDGSTYPMRSVSASVVAQVVAAK